ncbi:unnamed protein product, partial [Rotaria magnacalcarata]
QDVQCCTSLPSLTLSRSMDMNSRLEESVIVVRSAPPWQLTPISPQSTSAKLDSGDVGVGCQEDADLYVRSVTYFEGMKVLVQ